MSQADQTKPPAPTAESIREAARAAKPRPRGAILVPEWGGTVYVRVMTGDERAVFDRETLRRRKKDPDRLRFRERLVIATAEDQNGAPVFTAADEDMLAGMVVTPIDRFSRLSSRLNGFVEDEDESGN